MLQVARLAPKLLLEAGPRVVEFLTRQFNADGGAKGRSGQSDLYYTVFALEGLIAMQAPLPTEALQAYLRTFADGPDLDLVHLTCLARCWAALPSGSLDAETAQSLLQRIEAHRSRDGGYHPSPGAPTGTVYHAFLAFGAYQDLNGQPPQRDRLCQSLSTLRTDDGAFANDMAVKIGTTPATAAAVTLMRHLDIDVPAEVGLWLLAQCTPDGGFLASPQAPMPDLLSTATALHALGGLDVSTHPVKEACLDFIDSLWTGRAFCGHWADDVTDSEYTYYALLALGHLSL